MNLRGTQAGMVISIAAFNLFETGELELRFLFVLLVIITYPALTLRGTQAYMVISIAAFAYYIYQHVNRTGVIKKAFEQGVVVPTIVAACLIGVLFLFLFLVRRGQQGLEMSQRQRQKSFEESRIALEAEIEHANTLASSFTREDDGACIQMRLLYSLIAEVFPFIVQWAGCSLASQLGLIYITIYEGEYSICAYERKANVQEFSAVIYPSLRQLGGITEMEDKKQKLICKERYKKRADEENLSELDMEREKECGICMQIQTKVVLPNCSHAMCLNCYRKWHAQSKTCPFCRDSLKRVNSTDLWMLTSSTEVVDMETLSRENLKRLFNYIDKLPLLFYVDYSYYNSYSHYYSYISEDLSDHRGPDDYYYYS